MRAARPVESEPKPEGRIGGFESGREKILAFSRVKYRPLRDT